MGENPSPLGEDFSRLAVLCKIIARHPIEYMTSILFCVDHEIPQADAHWKYWYTVT